MEAAITKDEIQKEGEKLTFQDADLTQLPEEDKSQMHTIISLDEVARRRPWKSKATWWMRSRCWSLNIKEVENCSDDVPICGAEPGSKKAPE